MNGKTTPFLDECSIDVYSLRLKKKTSTYYWMGRFLV